MQAVDSLYLAAAVTTLLAEDLSSTESLTADLVGGETDRFTLAYRLSAPGLAPMLEVSRVTYGSPGEIDFALQLAQHFLGNGLVGVAAVTMVGTIVRTWLQESTKRRRIDLDEQNALLKAMSREDQERFAQDRYRARFLPWLHNDWVRPARETLEGPIREGRVGEPQMRRVSPLRRTRRYRRR